ncbi:MAG: (Fe-S)-binding protein [Chloroflexota bacterium]|nr:(Fe-S)-binding protein [Chloroflexota bacterium]
MDFEQILHRTRAFFCLDCGKCTGSCPVSRVDVAYSPRRTIERVLGGDPEGLINDRYLWSCLTCGLCTTRCPSDVDYPAFVIAARIEARKASVEGPYAHNGVMQHLMGIMTQSVEQDRMGWLTDELKTVTQGEDFYFVGCLPYFDVLFEDLGVVSTDTARNAVRLMNAVGITPVVSDDERCCGADLLLNGDEEGFRELARRNVEVIAASGAGRVIFTCPECYNAFRDDYPRYVGSLPFDLVHIAELLAGHLDELGLDGLDEMVTYQDPCRLGRYQGIYDEPRLLIEATGANLVEMRKNRANAVCCGSTGWVSCGQCAKGIQMARLREAEETGATTMITACPKCRIHLSCAVKDAGDEAEERRAIDVALEDLTGLLARAMPRDELGD